MSALRFKGDSKSVPTTPQGTRRNATFSPRIQFHDTWPSGEYDRRGEIATCNRLTPMLAQQIKEELNTFKMVWSLLGQNNLRCTDSTSGNGGSREFQSIYTLFLMKHDYGCLHSRRTKHPPRACCRHIQKKCCHAHIQISKAFCRICITWCKESTTSERFRRTLFFS
jgi:hypothetical protein